MSRKLEADTVSPISILCNLKKLISIPTARDYTTIPPSLIYAPVDDPIILSCGCIISRSFNLMKPEHKEFESECPVCFTLSVKILGECKNLSDLYKYYMEVKQDLKLSSNGNNVSLELDQKDSKDTDGEIIKDSHFAETESTGISRTSTDSDHDLINHHVNSDTNPTLTNEFSQNNLTFLAAFNDAMNQANQSTPSLSTESISLIGRFSQDLSMEDQKQSISNFKPLSPTSNSIDTSLKSLNNQRIRQLNVNPSNTAKPMDIQKRHPNKEILLSKNFPFFRRVYTHCTNNSSFFLKSKVYIHTQLSPNLTKFVLLTEKKWEVYTIDTEKPDKQPQLFCCGKSDASYGPSFDELRKVTKRQVFDNSNMTAEDQESLDTLNEWEHLLCRITENYLFITGTRGIMRVIDLNQMGLCVYTYKCSFPIRCLDASHIDNYVALGINGKDKYTQVEQAVIILIKLIPETTKSPFQVSTYHFTLPYRDPIGILQFSSDSQLLSVSTVLESRFLVISLTDPWKPTLVMKSQRRIDTSLDSEGITDMSFFPDNRLMTVVSLSQNSEPIVIDTNIASISCPDGVAKPKLLMKVDEVGSTIHRCCVSPRGDSVAYINRNGSVYIMTAPRMDDNDSKRVSLVLEVANASRAKEAASIKFDPDGYKLYALDRRGNLSIADFTAGTVESHTVTRCKILA